MYTLMGDARSQVPLLKITPTKASAQISDLYCKFGFEDNYVKVCIK